MPTVTVIALGLLALCTPVALGRALLASRGTTLVAPLGWTALGAAMLLAVKGAVLVSGTTSGDVAKWEFLAYSATFCPAIAILGAKRPQNRAWQFIVLAMWFTVAWPAIQSLVVRPGEVLELHPLWNWFCAILVLLWIGIQAATRFFWIALCFALGQLLLLAPHLPFALPLVDAASLDGLGLTFLALAAIQGALYPLLTPGWKSNVQPVHGWNRVWLDFRDYFGLIWWRPVIDRVNAAAKTVRADVYLDWHGFCSPPVDSSAAEHQPPQPASEEEIAKIDPALRNLLRRFVSNRWIDERL